MSTVLIDFPACANAQAQPMAQRVGVVHSTETSVPAHLVEAIDAAVLRDLAEVAGIVDPVVSPIDLVEIQLSVGCADDGRPCLESIARAAGVGALLVRSLAMDDEGGVRVELRYFDSASSDEPRSVSTQAPAQSMDALVPAVPRLVRELFGIPEVVAAAEPVAAAPAPRETRPRSPRASDRSALPWILMGTGAAALTAGVVVGAIAADDFDDWKKRAIRTTADADRANDDFEDLEARALAADVSMVGGAVVLGLGVTLLALDLGGEESLAADHAKLRLEPKPQGALLRLDGVFGEAW